jgi:hypothetical protein
MQPPARTIIGSRDQILLDGHLQAGLFVVAVLQVQQRLSNRAPPVGLEK